MRPRASTPGTIAELEPLRPDRRPAGRRHVYYDDDALVVAQPGGRVPAPRRRAPPPAHVQDRRRARGRLLRAAGDADAQAAQPRRPAAGRRARRRAGSAGRPAAGGDAAPRPCATTSGPVERSGAGSVHDADDLRTADRRARARTISRGPPGRRGAGRGAQGQRALPRRPRPASCRSRSRSTSSAISSYEPDSGRVRLVKDLDTDLTGRDVILVEDIVDTGLTLGYLLGELRPREPGLARGVHAARQAALAASCRTPLAYVGFEVPDVFVLGYGLDFAGPLPQPRPRAPTADDLDRPSARYGPRIAYVGATCIRGRAVGCWRWSRWSSSACASSCRATRRSCCCARWAASAGCCRSSSARPRPRPSPSPSNRSPHPAPMTHDLMQEPARRAVA